MYTFSYLYSSPVTFPILLCFCPINLQNRAWLVISPQRLFLLIRLQNKSAWMFCCKCLMCFPHQHRAQSCWACLKWLWNQGGVCCTFFVFTSWLCGCRRGKTEGNHCSPTENGINKWHLWQDRSCHSRATALPVFWMWVISVRIKIQTLLTGWTKF